MPIDYAMLKAVQFPTVRHSYSADDCILYALGVGAGLASTDTLGDETEFLFEEKLSALPAMASVLAYPGFWMRDAKFGIEWPKVMHGEQRVHIHAAIPLNGTVSSQSHVSRITDKGEARGAIVVTERRVTDTHSGKLIAVIEQTNFCRGDGGYSQGDSSISDEPLEPIAPPPDCFPDRSFELPTTLNLAAIYRLSGDRNPLHINPIVAREAGFDRPILHGLVLAGLSCRAVVAALPERDPLRIAGFDIRFSAPLYPGETVITDLWNEPNIIHFRCRSAERNIAAAFGCYRLRESGAERDND